MFIFARWKNSTSHIGKIQRVCAIKLKNLCGCMYNRMVDSTYFGVMPISKKEEKSLQDNKISHCIS